jgi:hypothetical protein
MNDEILTKVEIETRYPSEWVLVGDPESDENLEIVRGRVLFHSPDRDEMYRKAIELRPKLAATLFTGAPPEDEEFIL